MYDRKNGPFARESIAILQGSGAPSFSGQVSLWNQSGSLQLSTPLSGSLGLGDPLTRLGFAFTDTVTAPVASGVAALWNNSGFVQIRTPAAADIVLGKSIVTVPVVLASCVSGNVVARVSPDYACKAIALDLQCVQAPGNSGAINLQLGIQGTTTSGGLVTVTAGLMSGVGNRLAGSAVTGANAVGTSGEITVTVVSALSGAFGGGQGALFIKLGPPA